MQTCNHKMNFGISPIKNFIDDREKKITTLFFMTFSKMSIVTSVINTYTGLLNNVWEDLLLLFIDYFRKIKTSPFRKLIYTFDWKESQKYRDNLSHIHLTEQLDWCIMTEDDSDLSII